MQRAIKKGEGYRLDLRIIHAVSGEIRYVSATGGTLNNPLSHAPELLSGTLFDITHRKQLEASLAAARDAAESNARAKSSFLATMSHELRTPLNGIVGMTSLLRTSGLSSRQAAYCETIHQSAEALIAVVNDILDWSRIEADRMELEEIPFDFENVIRGVLDILAPQAQSKSIQLHFDSSNSKLP
ncbi:MAG: hypothetical protein FJW36_18605 [Acidobacteria bacterium]|nr:hypothetical protein [Acidobacteriota bacterium]